MTLGSADKGNQPVRVPYDAVISTITDSILYSSDTDVSGSSDSGSDTDTESKPNTSTRNNTNVNEQSANASPRTFPSQYQGANSPRERTSNTTSRNNSANASPRTFLSQYLGANSSRERTSNTTSRNNSANASPRTFPSQYHGVNSPRERTSNTTSRNNSANASPRTFPSQYHGANSPQERTTNTTTRNNEQSANSSSRLTLRIPTALIRDTYPDANEQVTNASPWTFPSRHHDAVPPNEGRKRRKLNSTREDVENLVNDTSSSSTKQENGIPFLIGKLVETVITKLPPPSAKQFMDRILVLMTEFNGLDEGTFFR